MEARLQVEQWLNPREFRREGQAKLGDLRRTQRLMHSMEVLAASPEASFPMAFNKHKDLEGFYRLVESSSVAWRDALSGHKNRTVGRVAEHDEVLIVHDTTDVRFPLRELMPMRENLGLLSTATQGFYVHASLAVSGTSEAVPLGTLGIQPFIHKKEAPDAKTEAFWEAEGGIMENERERWFSAIEATDAMVASASCSPIHVMDREADSYPMVAWLQHEDYRFVFRVCHLNRKVQDGSSSLDDALAAESFVAEATVHLGSRSPLRNTAKKAHPARKSRLATVSFRAAAVTIKRSREKNCSVLDREDLPQTLTVNLVEAVELNPPQGEEPVRWLLLTSEPIDTPEQIVRVVDIYKKRWLIEEFFKSLRTGCRLEDRQIKSAAAILNMLAILLPQAWRLLLLRSLSDETPDLSWRAVLEPLAFNLLKLEVPEAKLNDASTVRDVMLAVASFGGHIANNGSPGWITLHRGWSRLADLTRGARLQIKLQRRRRKPPPCA